MGELTHLSLLCGVRTADRWECFSDDQWKCSPKWGQSKRCRFWEEDASKTHPEVSLHIWEGYSITKCELRPIFTELRPIKDSASALRGSPHSSQNQKQIQITIWWWDGQACLGWPGNLSVQRQFCPHTLIIRLWWSGSLSFPATVWITGLFYIYFFNENTL